MESSKARLMRDWVLNEWSEKLGMILESMADKRPNLEVRSPRDISQTPPEDAQIWSQKLAISPEPLLWVGTPPSAARELGRCTLQAAGVDAIEEEDAQSTYSEILNQSLSALAQSITGHLGCEASTTDGAMLLSRPASLEWGSVLLQFDDQKLEPLWLAVAPALLDRLCSAGQDANQNAAKDSAEPEGTPVDGAGISSKTFDLLLDVALPVSVSFGRTFLPIKEVLKLNSGSIVELERAINEPVDIIVNNCVIARGEVVVVEGNYGVRIQQIASRHDRLRTGRDATQVQHALTLN